MVSVICTLSFIGSSEIVEKDSGIKELKGTRGERNPVLKKSISLAGVSSTQLEALHDEKLVWATNSIN